MGYEPGELNFIHKLLQSSLRPQIDEYVKKQMMHGPLIVEFDPTTACNFECPECISIGLLNRGQIAPDRALELITEFHRAGVRGIIFIGGGEPLAHTSIADLFAHADGLGMSIGLTTNGSLIHRHLETIAGRVKWTRVSIDAATQETFSIFRPSPIKNSLGKVLANVASLAKIKKGKIGYSFLLIERLESNGESVTNCHEILQAAQLARDIGCDYFEFKPIVDEHHHLIPFSAKVRGLIQEQLEALRYLNSENFCVLYPKSVEHLLNATSPDQPKTYTHCPTLELRTVVTPSGIYPCPYKRGYQKNLVGMPNVKFDDFWPSEERRARTQRINPSVDCRFYCIRHEVNLLLNALTQNYSEGVDLLRYLIQTDVVNDLFI